MAGRLNKKFIGIVGIVVVTGAIGIFAYVALDANKNIERAVEYTAIAEVAANAVAGGDKSQEVVAQDNYADAVESYGKHFAKGRATLEQAYEAIRIEGLRKYDDMQKASDGRRRIYSFYNASVRVDTKDLEPFYKQLGFLFSYLHEKNSASHERHDLLEMAVKFALEMHPDDLKLRKYDGIVKVKNYEVDRSMSEKNGKGGFDSLTAYLESNKEDAVAQYFLGRWHIREGERFWELRGDSLKLAKIEFEKVLAIAQGMGENENDVAGLIHRLMLFDRLGVVEGAKELVSDDIKKASIEDLEKRVLSGKYKLSAFEFFRAQGYLANNVMGNDLVDGESKKGKVLGRFVRSQTIGELGVKQYPDDLRLKYFLSQAFYVTNRLPESLKLLDEIELGDKQESAFDFYNNYFIRSTAEQSEVNWLVRQYGRLDEGDRERLFAKADKFIKKYVELKRDNLPFINYLRGKLAFFKSDFLAAAKYFELANKSDNINPRYIRAEAELHHLVRKQYGHAMALYERLRGSNLATEDDMYKYAAVAISAKKYRIANGIIEGYLKKDPEKFKFVFLKLQLMASQKQYGKYVAYLKSVGGLEDTRYALQYAGVLAKTGNTDKAKEIYRKYLTANPSDARSMFRLVALGVSDEEGKKILALAEAAKLSEGLIGKLRSEITGEVVAGSLTDKSNKSKNVQIKFYQYLNDNNHAEAKKQLAEMKTILGENNPTGYFNFEMKYAIGAKDWDFGQGIMARAKEAGVPGDKLALMEIDYYVSRKELGDKQKAYDICKAQLEVVEADAEMQLKMGALAYSLGHVEEAKEALDKAIQYKPSLARAKYILGEISVQLGQHADALVQYRAAYNIDKQNDLYLDKYLTYEALFGNVDRVIAIRKDLAEQSPKRYDNRINLVFAHLKEKQYEKALAIADKLVKDTAEAKAPISLRSRCVSAKARVMLSQNKGDDARLYWQDFIAEIGNEISVDVYLAYAQFFTISKKYDDARIVLQSAISIEDEKVRRGSLAMVALLSQAGRVDEMYKYLPGLLKLFPKRYGLHSLDVTGLISLGKFDEASDKLNAYKSQSEFPVAYAGLEADLAWGRLLVAVKSSDNELIGAEYRKALIEINKTIEATKGRLPKYLVYRVMLRDSIRRFPDASDEEKGVFTSLVKDMEDAIAKQPQNFTWRMRLGSMYSQEGLTSKALEEFNGILKLDSSYLQGVVAVANIYHGVLGQPDRAIKVYMDAIADDAKDLTLKFNFAVLYKKLKQYNKAEEMLEAVYSVRKTDPRVVIALCEIGFAKRTPGKVLKLLDDHPVMVEKVDELKRFRAMGLWRTKKMVESSAIFASLLKDAKDAKAIREVADSVGQVMGPVDGAAWLIKQADAMTNEKLNVIVRARALIFMHSDKNRDVKQVESEMLAIIDKLDKGVGNSRYTIVQKLASDAHQRDDFKNAVKYYTELIDDDDNNHVTHNNLASIYMENLNNPVAGLVHAKKAFEIKPKNYSVIDTYAWALFKTGDVKGAQKHLFESIKIKEVSFNTLHLAETLLSEPNAAWRWLKKAKEHVENEKATHLLPEIKRLEELLKK